MLLCKHNTIYRSVSIIDRHDDPEEKARDEARAKLLESHRFKSFSQERDGNICKWHVDGHDFMWALADLMYVRRIVVVALLEQFTATLLKSIFASSTGGVSRVSLRNGSLTSSQAISGAISQAAACALS